MKKNILPIFVCILLFIFIEAIACLVIPYVKFSKLHSILQVLEEHPELFWRQRVHLNTEFQGVKIITNSLGLRAGEIPIEKREKSYRIFCMGASPTFGWGVDIRDSYPSLLKQNLIGAKSGKKIEVVNAGEIGYSTYQGIVFLKKYILKYSPDLITVSYIINDIDRYRFYRNEGVGDSNLGSSGVLATGLRNIIARSRAYQLFRECIFNLLNRNKKTAALMLREQFDLAKIRIPPEEYKKNLEELVNICRNHGIKIIFIKMPVNLSLPRLSSDEQNIVKDGSSLSTYYYNKSCKYESLREYQKACDFFKKAKDYLVFECDHDKAVYQKLMEEVARKDSIPLVDAAKAFANKGNKQKMFNVPHDPIHPSAEGHKLIAEEIKTTILRHKLIR